MEAGIFLGVAQPVDAVALHEAHGAGVVVGPDRLRAVAPLRRRGISRRRDRARRPRRSARTSPSPSARCGAAAASAGRDGGCARRSARPWRRSRPRCRRCPARRARGRWCGRRAPRPRARRSTGNHADRRNGRSGWVAAAGGRADSWRPREHSPADAVVVTAPFRLSEGNLRTAGRSDLSAPRRATACGPARRRRSSPASSTPRMPQIFSGSALAPPNMLSLIRSTTIQTTSATPARISSSIEPPVPADQDVARAQDDQCRRPGRPRREACAASAR